MRPALGPQSHLVDIDLDHVRGRPQVDRALLAVDDDVVARLRHRDDVLGLPDRHQAQRLGDDRHM